MSHSIYEQIAKHVIKSFKEMHVDSKKIRQRLYGLYLHVQVHFQGAIACRSHHKVLKNGKSTGQNDQWKSIQTRFKFCYGFKNICSFCLCLSCLPVYHYGQGSILPKCQQHLHHFYFITHQQLMYCIHFSPDTPGPLCCPFKRYEIGSGETTHACIHTELQQTQCLDQYATWKWQFDSWCKRRGLKHFRTFCWETKGFLHLSQTNRKFIITVMLKSYSNFSKDNDFETTSFSSSKDWNYLSPT